MCKRYYSDNAHGDEVIYITYDSGAVMPQSLFCEYNMKEIMEIFIISAW